MLRPLVCLWMRAIVNVVVLLVDVVVVSHCCQYHSCWNRLLLEISSSHPQGRFSYYLLGLFCLFRSVKVNITESYIKFPNFGVHPLDECSSVFNQSKSNYIARRAMRRLCSCGLLYPLRLSYRFVTEEFPFGCGVMHQVGIMNHNLPILVGSMSVCSLDNGCLSIVWECPFHTGTHSRR